MASRNPDGLHCSAMPHSSNANGVSLPTMSTFVGLIRTESITGLAVAGSILWAAAEAVVSPTL